MLKNMKILPKQLAGFGMVTLIALVIGLIGYSGIQHQKAEMEYVLETAPLIDAAMEMKLAVSEDMQTFMELMSASTQRDLDETWNKHLGFAKTYDIFSNAITNGANTDEGMIYATKDEKLKSVVSEADRFHNDQFLPKLKKGHELAAQKIAGQAVSPEALTTLDKEIDAVGQRMLALLGKVEEDAKAEIDSAKLRAIDASGHASLILVLAIAAGVALAIFLSGLTARLITVPIRQAVQHTERMAGGDFSHQLHIDQADEVGTLARALNRMTESLRTMIGNVASGVQTLTASSTQLSAISEQMSQNSEGAAQQSGSVATATEEMSSNMRSVATASEQLSTNVQMVATASEEMSATVAEIAKSSETASTITAAAVTKATSATQRVGELGTSAHEISKVTEVITEISDQTNLLALNATIEAARAGEAGKGFAVVANEIKELAKQTAQATAEIKNRISSIQTTTAGTVAEIEEIAKVINNVNEIVATIAAAAEEQSVTTRDIVQNIAQAAQGVQEVNQNISQSTQVSEDIAKEISSVNNSAAEISGASTQVLSSSKELSALAEQLNQLVRQFRI
ncbi:MAG: methyl-accepting chemotaxis protein [Desulfobacteraceae bacterium]|nr:methyl-accepting chemotaxis protein [Desulfobacteraceae bacterium]